MEWASANDIGLFGLRIALAYVYLHAAWMISRNAAKRTHTTRRTSVLSRGTPLADNMTVATVMTYIGFALMYLGSLGLILGIATKTTAALLIVFTIPGIVIHLRERDQSLELVDQAQAAAGKGALPALQALRVSTYAAHQSSANKNYGLIGACVFLLLAENPNGRFILSAFW